jgi:hypothetical protein
MNFRDEKVAEAKAKLGENYILHPNYNPNRNPQHIAKQSLLLAPVRSSATKKGKI